MNLTPKETSLLKDLTGQEKLCWEKYDKYSCDACAEELKNLFSEMAQTERQHYDSVCQMLGGTVPMMPTGLQNENNRWCKKVSYTDDMSKNIDKFLCTDMLASEKHASSLYDVSVFEFTDPAARKALNHIQAEEQQHGEKLWAYMSQNGMYPNE